MEAEFWQQKWEKNEIGFHEGAFNSRLVKHWHKLALEEGSRVLVPLCGKTNDIAWLLSQGYYVVGVELVESAVEQLFKALGVMPDITDFGNLKRYSADYIDIFVGDIFALTSEPLGSINAIYDRAALVALPADMRNRYTKHLVNITVNKPQLLITFEYDQTLIQGPPFSVSNEEVKLHYKDHYHLTLLQSEVLEGGLKGKYPAIENIWLLTSN